MLTNLKIQGFRCFRDVDVPLRPLTVLIGPNDTGKSAFVDAIELLGPYDPKRVTVADLYRSGEVDEFRIFGINDDESNCETVGISGGRGNVSLKRGRGLNDHQLQRFQLPVTGVATSCHGFNQGERASLALRRDGARTAAVLDHLLRSDLSRFLSLRERFMELVPGLEDISIETPQPETRRIDLVIDNNYTIPASRASAGVRLLLFFLALTYHPNPPNVVLLEEPENGIHPRRLAEVMDLLRKLTNGELSGDPAQVILTTHSPYLLDLVDLDTDQVLVFQREDDGSRSVQPADKERIQEFFDGFMLGEVWYNAQEAGLVGEANA